MTQAPPALTALTKAFAARPDRPKSYQLGGIVGDARHMSPPEGYHVSPRDEGFRWGAYSLETSRDRAGGKSHPDFASAWDLSMNTADMILVTTRLITAAKAKDPRLNAVAEIAGTTNGTTVHAFYVNTGRDDPNNSGGWDHSHTSHVHLSISRDDCDNYDALAPILDVICGVPTEEFTVTQYDNIMAALAKIEAAQTAQTKAIVDHIDGQISKVVHGGATKPGSTDSSQDAQMKVLADIQAQVTKP